MVFRKTSAVYCDNQIKPIKIQHATLQNATAGGMQVPNKWLDTYSKIIYHDK